MTGRSQKSQSFVQIGSIPASIVTAAEMDSLTKEVTNETSRSIDAEIFGGDIILQSVPRVDTQLARLVDGATKPRIPLTSVHIVGVVFRIVDVLFGSALVNDDAMNLGLKPTGRLPAFQR